MGVPEYAGEDGGVYRAPVNQNEELVGVLSVEAAGADGPFVSIDLRYVKAGNHAQQIWNVECARVANILLRDDEDSRRGLGKLLLPFGYGGHFNVHQVFEALLGKVGGLCRAC